MRFKQLVAIVTCTYLSISCTPKFSSPDEMLNFVRQLLPSHPVVLEAGGHYGEDTKRIKLAWPESTIHVFEPMPSSFEKVMRVAQQFSTINAYPYALSNFCGTTHFYFNPVNDGMSSIGFPAEQFAHHFNKEPINVNCTTIDSWAQQYAIDHIDFMWLDMEGHELYALQAGLDILRTVKAIYTEVDFIPVRQGAGLYTDLKEFLESQGFTEIWKSRDWGENADALFVKKEEETFKEEEIIGAQQNFVAIPLGCNCTTAHFLRECNVRPHALPFDWVLLPFEALCTIIKNDFKDYFKKEHLIASSKKMFRPDLLNFVTQLNYLSDTESSLWVLDKELGMVFVHDFSNNSPATINTYYQSQSEKYKRRIDRLYNDIHSGKRIYFIRYLDTSKEQAITLYNLLHTKFPSCDFTLIVIGNTAHEFAHDWRIPHIKNYFTNSLSWQTLCNNMINGTLR